MRPQDFAEFLACTEEAALVDCKFTGCYLTWTNNQQGDARIAEKLYRVMVNAQWMNPFPNAEADFLTTGVSDHSPAILTIWEGLNAGPKPFKFFNTLTHDREFMDIVNKAWCTPVTGNPIFRLVQKLNKD